jgi:hypothetical protein
VWPRCWTAGVTNLAGHLCGEARPGHILIPRRLATLVEGRRPSRPTPGFGCSTSSPPRAGGSSSRSSGCRNRPGPIAVFGWPRTWPSTSRASTRRSGWVIRG